MWMVGAVSSLLASHASPMTFTPLPGLPFGAIVTGVLLGDLRYGDSSTSIVSKALLRGLHHHRLLVFRDQGRLPWASQINLTALFGPVFEESAAANRAPHPSTPDPRVALFSNDPVHGA